MTVIRRADQRRTSTPNAVMTTHASPTQGAAGLAVWHVDMVAGAAGPRHTFDVEQVWTVLDGAAVVELDGHSLPVTPGDTIVLPAGVSRRVLSDPADGATFVVAAPGGARVSTDDGREPFVPEWIL